jgi:hypothetical protein
MEEPPVDPDTEKAWRNSSSMFENPSFPSADGVVVDVDGESGGGGGNVVESQYATEWAREKQQRMRYESGTRKDSTGISSLR